MQAVSQKFSAFGTNCQFLAVGANGEFVVGALATSVFHEQGDTGKEIKGLRHGGAGEEVAAGRL